ncbi:tripartite tricarboxylate transporter substrate binding protein [Chelativorans sp. AA-79]|uniref:Bug family tripartite tricarboxylate transporter substrate binding protein n=1 Tax=Chelativorans sp. AA-79 TaxID=3028735 RepID=UPI0023F627A3|nr:tripartite tricarboxylate transporter substrate binding protein [Chelativorans sp. AA-79]WEX10770.1 tripartite tricarboxylate transporter substrate binding protein [Chelativorans sp. AA-79]
MKHLAIAFAAAVPLLWGATAATAQSWPEKEITLRVPLGAGGSTDTAARVIAQYLGEELGQAVIVENRPGAGGVIATTALMRDAADGYTLQYSPSSLFTSEPLRRPDLAYKVEDFDFIVSFGGSSPTLSVNEASGVTDLKAFLDDAKANGTRITYGHPGAGSTLQLAGERLFQEAGVTAQQIPFESGGAALTALLAGDITAYIGPETTILPYVGEGAVPLAVASANRSPFLPDVPTMTELGYDVSLESLSALHAPAGLPDEVQERLQTALTNLEQNEEFKAALERIGVAVNFRYGDAVVDYIATTRAVLQELMGNGG